jgi:hypothetical protein
VTWEQLCKLGQALPETSVGVWYRTPALMVRGKGFVRLKEDGQSVVFMLEDVGEQEALIDARPQVYFITDHYRGYPAVLARLSRLGTAEARVRLERSWLRKAPPSLLRAAKDSRASRDPAATGRPRRRGR